jgi:hypothetical protein
MNKREAEQDPGNIWSLKEELNLELWLCCFAYLLKCPKTVTSSALLTHSAFNAIGLFIFSKGWVYGVNTTNNILFRAIYTNYDNYSF